MQEDGGGVGETRKLLHILINLFVTDGAPSKTVCCNLHRALDYLS